MHQHVVDALFKGTGGNEAVHENVSALSDAECPVCGLSFDGRIPPEVIVNDGRRRGKVKPCAARLEGENETSHGAVFLKAVDHSHALLCRYAAVQKVGALAESLRNPILKPFAHFAVLRKNEHLAVGISALRKDFQEGIALAGIGRQR